MTTKHPSEEGPAAKDGPAGAVHQSGTEQTQLERAGQKPTQEAGKLIGQDEILEEVWAIREALAAEYDYDLGRLFEALRARAKQSDREVLEPIPKRVVEGESA
ncbi:MAG: hypothetical protein AAGI71_15620 [Bacteroidota bacterium]